MEYQHRSFTLAVFVVLLAVAGCNSQGQGNVQSSAQASTSSGAAQDTKATGQKDAAQTSGQEPSASLISNPVTGGDAKPAQNGPAPQAVYQETSYDGGNIDAGTPVTHTFAVKNTGKGDLLIESVQPGCGCTVADFTKVVPPGQEGKITLTVKTDTFRGAIEKHATVTSNDPTNPTLSLSLKANIRQLVEILPGPYLSIQINKGQPAEGKVTLVNNDTSPLNILDVKSNNPEFTIWQKTLEDGKKYEIGAKLNKNDVAGHFNTTLTVTTNNKKQEQIVIPVMVQIAARVEAYPEKLVYGRLSLDALNQNPNSNQLLVRTITVRSKDAGFKVTKVESSLPFVQWELVNPPADGQPYSVKITVAKEKLPKGPFTGTITLQTNDKEFGQLKVPVIGEVN